MRKHFDAIDEKHLHRTVYTCMEHGSIYTLHCPECAAEISADLKKVRFWTGCRRIYLALLFCTILLYAYYKLL